MCLIIPSFNQNFKAKRIAGMDNSWKIPEKVFAGNDYASNGLTEKSRSNNVKVQIINTTKGEVPVDKETSKTIFSDKLKAKKRAVTSEKKEFTLTMVNAELLENKALEATVSTVVNKVKDSVRSVFVKVEEQQSGQPQTNTFYLKVNNTNGKTDIQPLIIIKKFKGTSPASKRLSVLKAAKQATPAANKKRVTT